MPTKANARCSNRNMKKYMKLAFVRSSSGFFDSFFAVFWIDRMYSSKPDSPVSFGSRMISVTSSPTLSMESSEESSSWASLAAGLSDSSASEARHK